MWGFRGRSYWGRKERGQVQGIVVVFAWMSSEERHLKSYVDLYSSLGWNSVVCHSQFLNLFFPDTATLLALEILNELVEELKIKPCPIVFASFSGGPKACMYKVLQIIEGRCEAEVNLDKYRLVGDCLSGQIYDSCPIDFTSDLGTRFILHPTILKMSRPPSLATWIANGISSALDALFLSRFESQRAEYWQTLYSSVCMGAPYLIMCSQDDDLAPCDVICNFAQRLRDLGGFVKVVKWQSSPHVGHYWRYANNYKAAVSELLGKASLQYSQKIRQLEVGKMGLEGTMDEISGPLSDLKKALISSSQSFQRVAVELNDHYFVPTSVEHHQGRGVGSILNEQKKGVIPLSSPPTINPHGVLGQILFDVCVPKNVEDWDIRSSPSFNGPLFSFRRRNSSFNPIKCIRRSRL